MSAAANDDAFSVQRLRGGFAIVWREGGKRRRRQLESTDRKSAEAEARALWQAGDVAPVATWRFSVAFAPVRMAFDSACSHAVHGARFMLGLQPLSLRGAE